MPTTRKLSQAPLKALRQLREMVATHRGWVWRGVDGWALGADLDVATRWNLTEQVHTLLRRHFVDQENVSEASHKQPLYVYRITQAGASFLSELDGVQALEVPPLGCEEDRSEHFYISPVALEVLNCLRDHHQTVNARYFTDENSWVASNRLRGLLRRTSYEGELLWLIRYGLVEVRYVMPPERVRPSRAFRVTELGLRVRPLSKQG